MLYLLANFQNSICAFDLFAVIFDLA